MKLKKLQDNYYIVDMDAKGKEGYNYNFALGKIDKLSRDYDKASSENSFLRKITHSTEINLSNDIEYIPLSEVEEAINGYSAEKMALEKYPLSKLLDVSDPDYEFRLNLKQIADTVRNVWTEGFKAAMELNKDKLFTIEDMREAIYISFRRGNERKTFFDSDYSIINSYFPKTEWDVEFVDGKIKLI